MGSTGHLRSMDALTLFVGDMARSLRFYQSLTFGLAYGSDDASFCSLRVHHQFLNLMLVEGYQLPAAWGRVIFHVDDVDAVYRLARAAGHRPEAPPRDAEWGERYFHLRDPDGHELSFARRL